MIASTFFDLVLGVDMHFEMVPMPAPVPVPFPHPFVGMVFDPAGLVSGLLVSNAIGMVTGAPPTGPVLVNFMPATNTGTDVKNKMVLPHFVIPPGTMWTPMPKAPKPKIGKHAAPAPDLPVAPAGDAVLMMGSKTVTLMGSNAVRLGDLAMSCSEPVRLPSSVVLAIPKGLPVMMGGPPAIDWQQAMGALLRSKWVSNHLHGLVSRIKNQRWRNFFHKAVCFLTGHPVDVATGRLLTWSTDFELPGPLPLKFERNYASSWSDRDSVLGFGWSHSLDQAVWLERGKVVYRAEDGREIEFDTFDFPDHAMRKGDTCYDPFNRLTLRSLGQFRWEIETADGLTHEFAPVPGDSRKGYARLITQRTRDGHAIQLAYDAQGCLEWVTDSAGRRILFAHDEWGRLTRIALPHPREQKWVTHARYVYSSEGDLVDVHDALGNVARWAYEGHLLVKETDRTGLSFYFGYDGVGSDAACIRTWGDGGIYDHEILYDKQKHITAVTNSLGHTVMYFATAMNAVMKVMDPLGGETQYEYDHCLRKTAERDAHGLEKRWLYDERGNCTRVINPDGTEQIISYGLFDQPTQVITETGATWNWEYDRVGQMTTQVDPEGQLLKVKYKQGLVDAIRYPWGATEQFEYDNYKNMVAITDTNGHVTRYMYDRLGRVVEIKNAIGGITRIQYNVLGDAIVVESPSGVRAQYTYDAEQNLISFVDETRSIRLRYGGYNKVVEQDDGGAKLRYVFDTEENLVAVVNEADECYTFKLDACGRVQEEVAFDGQKRTYLREKGGWITKTILPGGRSNEHTYDKVGRLAQIKYHDGSFVRFMHGPRGLACVENESSRVEIERDLLGRIVTERVNGHEVSSWYGPDGGRMEIRTSLGARVAVIRDPLGQVRELSLDRADGVKGAYVQFERDALGLERAKRYGNGVDIEWTRDLAGRPTARHLFRREESRGPMLFVGPSDNAGLDARTYQWRGEDQIAEIVDRATSLRSFDHDRRGRLIREKRSDRMIERAVDVVGNVYRTGHGRDRRYGTGGQLLEAEGCRYEHDLDGNVVSKVEPDGGRWAYRWNGAGMMVEVVRPDSVRVAFKYDGFARRIAKQVMTADGAVTRETQFVWDGHTVVHELDSGFELTTWHWEPETFTPVAKESRGRKWSIASDHLGTPTEMYDESGRLALKMQLDLFGMPNFSAGEAGDCPWRWPGQYADEETGLYYNRFRYYDPDAGKYISQDPIGLTGGLALYAYVFDSLTLTDVFGLSCETGRDAFGETRFRGLVQNRQLRDLTHHEIVRAFRNSPFELTNHAILRLKDIRTKNLGFTTLNDIARLLNRGVIGESRGATTITYGTLSAIVDPGTRRIISIVPI
jgi:RHS repeat-associated protein